MNLGQFKDPLSHLCLASAVVASWSLILETIGLNLFNDNYLSLNLANSTKTLGEIQM